MGNCQKDDDEELSQSNGIPQMRITNYMWNKDYQGLFDYETKAVEKKVIKLTGSAIVAKNIYNFILMNEDLNALSSEKLKQALFQLSYRDSIYQIFPITFEKENFTLQKLVWLVVASLPNKSHQIRQKDILKLGKQKVRIRQIVHADSNASSLFDSPLKLKKNVYENLLYNHEAEKVEKQQIKEEKSEATDSEKVCRICLDPGDYQNPLITPCKCSGSVKYIHLNCLRSWLAKRLNASKTPHCITINWQPLSCEMCKASFRYRIYMDNKKFYTVEIPKPPKPYIVIELMRKNTSTKGKVFHFISFGEKKKVSLGRRKDVDVRIADDISISRVHASIEYDEENKSFILTDNKSKFGTLALVKKGVKLKQKFNGISFQIGAEVFSFETAGQSNYEDDDEYLVKDESEIQEDMEENPEGQSESEMQNQHEEQNMDNSPSLPRNSMLHQANQ